MTTRHHRQVNSMIRVFCEAIRAENERAMVGARMANLKAHRPVSAPMGVVNSQPAISIERAAELSGSSRKSIERAKPIVQSGIQELQDMENERALVGERMASLKKGCNQYEEGSPRGLPSKPAGTMARAAELAGSYLTSSPSCHAEHPQNPAQPRPRRTRIVLRRLREDR